jgi:hypothetical protein
MSMDEAIQVLEEAGGARRPHDPAWGVWSTEGGGWLRRDVTEDTARQYAAHETSVGYARATCPLHPAEPDDDCAAGAAYNWGEWTR